MDESDHGRKHGAEGGAAKGAFAAGEKALRVATAVQKKTGVSKPKRKSRKGTKCVNYDPRLPALSTCTAPLLPHRECECRKLKFRI
jgi:hypothetical protein